MTERRDDPMRLWVGKWTAERAAYPTAREVEEKALPREEERVEDLPSSE